MDLKCLRHFEIASVNELSNTRRPPPIHTHTHIIYVGVHKWIAAAQFIKIYIWANGYFQHEFSTFSGQNGKIDHISEACTREKYRSFLRFSSIFSVWNGIALREYSSHSSWFFFHTHFFVRFGQKLSEFPKKTFYLIKLIAINEFTIRFRYRPNFGRLPEMCFDLTIS